MSKNISNMESLSIHHYLQAKYYFLNRRILQPFGSLVAFVILR